MHPLKLLARMDEDYQVMPQIRMLRPIMSMARHTKLQARTRTTRS